MGHEDVLALRPAVVPAATAVDEAWVDFAAAWRPLQDRLFRIALLIAGERADAEDAVADAMAATYAPWKAGRVKDLPAYSRTAVVNRLTGRGRRKVVADRFRQRRTGDDRGAREVADHVVDRDLLRQALAELPTRQRAIVVLRFYGELSVAETAQVVGCAEGTVKSQSHAALATLRDRLGAAEEGTP